MELPPKIVISLSDVDVEDGDIGLQSITLDVPKDSRLAVLGLPNSGKSTLVKTLAGLVKITAGAGRILDNPLPLMHGEPRVGFLHQAINWAGRLTIMDIMRMVNQHAVHNDLETLLTFAGLQDKRNTTVDRLCAKERQLTGLIALHLQNPDVLILDDPADGFVSEKRRAILDMIKRIGTGRTILYTTSSYTDMVDIATHVAVLEQRTILTSGTFPEVLSRPETMVFKIMLMGDTNVVFEQLKTVNWVSHMIEHRTRQHTEWTVWLRDEGDTPSHLLRAILADRRLQVIQFNQIRPRIDSFLNQLKQTLT